MKLLRDVFDLPGVAALAGLGMAAAGLALVYLPLALIVPGAVIFALATWRRL